MTEDTALIRLDQAITGQAAVDRIATAMRSAAFRLEAEDEAALAQARDLIITDGDDYQRGFALLAELGTLAERVTTHYSRFDGPLRALTKVVQSLKAPTLTEVDTIKKALSGKLTRWKADQERLAREEARKRQEEADAAAKAAQRAQADVLRKLAEAEQDQKLAQSYEAEAAVVEALPVYAAPVEMPPVVPAVDGYTRTGWKGHVTDLKTLLTAYVEGRCFLPEDAIIEGLQTFLDRQASSLQTQLSQAFPGTEAQPVYTAVARRRR